MGRRYVLSGNALTLGAGNVLAAIQPAAANAAGSWLEIERVEASQNGTTTSGQCNLYLAKRNTAGTLTIVSATPSPLVQGGPASGIAGGTNGLTAATCGLNASTDSGGAYVYGPYFNFNNLGGFLWQPIPDHKIIVPAGVIFVVGFVAAPTGTTGWSVNVYYHEVY